MKKLYRSYQESTDLFNHYAKQYPHLMTIESIGQTWEKREINLITLSNNIDQHDQYPALLYTGTIHAREWIGHELAIDFISYVLENLTVDPILQTILSQSTLYMIPCANPDGFEYSRQHFSFWRKNRRDNKDGTFGVDLNRNFPIGFLKTNNTASNIYGGPEPFSEPETQALKVFVESHTNITIALDYHSQGNVFFPAHDFRHEDTIDTTDMNILCANMAKEIQKISGREYGIHQGKPPAKLISGSGREFYYSKGIISTVVEVGTRNISDYMDDMSENIREHIPALLRAATEVPNYSQSNPLKAVSNFRASYIDSNSVTLQWNYKQTSSIHFEIYRSYQNKQPCHPDNLISRTQNLEFTDNNLQSSCDYYYNIRVVDTSTIYKSPFTPQIRIKTLIDYDEFNRIYYANSQQTGYVASHINNNARHFGVNSLFVGVDKTRGVSYAVITIDVRSLPDDAIIKKARFSLYPINRVSTTIEKYGEWNVGIVDQDTMGDITLFEDVHAMSIIQYIGAPTKSHHLTQGIWRNWSLSGYECTMLSKSIRNKKIVLRVEGPKDLKIGRKSQMMQWDIGYGQFGFGLTYRPFLELNYTLQPQTITLFPKKTSTISQETVQHNSIECGFDHNGSKVYSTFEFNLSALPPYDFTIITEAYFELNSLKTYIKDDIRFHLEFIDDTLEQNYEGITQRDVIQNIGFDISANELRNNQKQYFIFDTYARNELNKKLKDKSNITFVLKPTTSNRIQKNSLVYWSPQDNELSPKLVIDYIPKRRYCVDQVKNLTLSKENGMIKLSWDNPTHKDFAGVKVIKNAFHEPSSNDDGQKLYAGKDNYTFDNFGADDISKYYAVYTYDNVPNYSKPVIIKYNPK